MENGQAIGGLSTYLEPGNHTTEMTNKTFTLAPMENGLLDRRFVEFFWTDFSEFWAQYGAVDRSVCELYFEFLIFARPAKIKEWMRQKNTRDVSIILEQTLALCRESKVGDFRVSAQ